MIEHDLLRMIAEVGHAAWMNTLVGNPAPIVEEAGKRMRNPRAGDLVLETSTFYFREWRPQALGFLRRTRMEPILGRVEFCEGILDGDYWDHPGESYDEFADKHVERVWYVQPLGFKGPLTGTGPALYRWHNADFIALPVNREFRDEVRVAVDARMARR